MNREDDRALEAYVSRMTQAERYDSYCVLLEDMQGQNSEDDIRLAYFLGQIYLPDCLSDIVRLIGKYMDVPYERVLKIVK